MPINPEYYEDLEMVQAMIEEDGGPITFERPVTAATSREWRKGAVQAPLTFGVQAVVTKVRKSQESQGYTSGAEDTLNTLPGWFEFLFAPQTLLFEPVVRDIVIDAAGQRYTVLDFNKLAPGGVELLYTVLARK